LYADQIFDNIQCARNFHFLFAEFAGGFLVIKLVEHVSAGVIQNELIAILGDSACKGAKPRAWFPALPMGIG
jgi:hypothetical protein